MPKNNNYLTSFLISLFVKTQFFQKRFDEMIAAASLFLDQFVSEGSAVGIVQFASVATTLSEMVVITSPDDQEKLKKKLPKLTSGSTGIGDGILTAIEVTRH